MCPQINCQAVAAVYSGPKNAGGAVDELPLDGNNQIPIDDNAKAPVD